MMIKIDRIASDDDRAAFAIRVYVLVCVLCLLAGILWCECGYTPDCMPPDGVIEPGVLRIPPEPGKVVTAQTTDHKVVGMSFQDWRMLANWDGAAPEWWDPVDWIPATYWWLTENDYHAYGRFGCRQEINETGTDWVCIAQFWAFYQDDVVTYRMYKDINCTEWVLTEEQNLKIGTPAMARRVTRRVPAAPRE